MNGEFVIATHAMVYLHHKGGWQPSEEIAANVCTNPVCVRKVMAKLVRAGLVEKKEGSREGGYCFEKTRAVNLRQIADALGVKLVETRYRSGNPDKPCMIASGMGAYMDEVCAGLDGLCRERLEQITIADAERYLEKRKNGRVW